MDVLDIPHDHAAVPGQACGTEFAVHGYGPGRGGAFIMNIARADVTG